MFAVMGRDHSSAPQLVQTVLPCREGWILDELIVTIDTCVQEHIGLISYIPIQTMNKRRVLGDIHFHTYAVIILIVCRIIDSSVVDSALSDQYII